MQGQGQVQSSPSLTQRWNSNDDDQTKMAVVYMYSDENKKASQKMANVGYRNAARKPHLGTHLANVQ